ncbi:MAG: SDR family NAD(P)-dependent oxidoreductase [Alphaproteobacteria bacterium]|jgi:3-oxoacyl-[acyl-carrier protein] reductase|nr:SDR family oxidoreductase [Rhodospirillaceae bacterium]MDG2481751.1 SDR family NAD(P)-dependent oxidoreductase [Alphaproteobacteria bacterium]MBT6204226.1 SDR family oxidoreductase [Rhodospirillaceae bacterium]MBT6510915.1 SDR family oxidoreductase [Rhodospirillaceae bacterium]MBT7615240.1 SDR family oxidoreductase [Rhodospirillaceae bacterium]
MISFNDRVAVVTGAAGGIGRSICRMMVEAGARVIVADLDGEVAEALALELDAEGTRAAGFAHDVRCSDDADALMAFAVERFGSLDMLVTAAGLFPPAPLEEIDDEAWRNVLAINLDSVMFCSRAAAPLMGEGASMVHIASLAGHRGAVRHAHYAAAKGGVLALTRTLATELAPRGIRANAVSPGLIDTTMIKPVMARRGDIILATTPMARVGTPDEVASVICFLASDLASFVTGETIQINGGLYINS